MSDDDDNAIDLVVPGALAGERLDRVVAIVTERSRTEIAELIKQGQVQVDGDIVRTRSRRVEEGETLTIVMPEPPDLTVYPDASVEVPVVYEDDGVIVVDKPADLVVHPGAGHSERTMVHGLLARYPEIEHVGETGRPGIVHRLDRGTSGLLVVARTPAAYDALVEAFASRGVTRQYRAMAWGIVTPGQGTIDAPVGRDPKHRTKMAVVVSGRPARTNYQVAATFQQPITASELICQLETGRTHQIRVHLATIGHPVVGDLRYGGARTGFPVDRVYLHAEELAFEHPITGEPLQFSAPLPTDLQTVRDRFS